jgi:hypothetical protein
MTDESTSGDGNPEKLSALEREKRIRGLFNHWAASREGLDWYPLIWDKKTGYFSESILTPDDIYKMPCLPKEQKNSYSLFTIAWWYLEDEFHPCAGYHEIPEQILSVMGNLDILPQNFTKEDMCCFLAERAALAGWRELDFLAKEDDVPLGAPIWWMKYLKQPDVNAINPVKICAFLITAKMLPPNFREIDFLKFILERHYISAAIPSNHFGCVDNPLIWELSAEGIATAEQLGLLDSSGNLIETETTDITPGAGAGTSTKPASSPKENAKGDISGFFSIRGLAQRNNIPEYKFEAFEKAVRRWHRDNPESSAVQETTYRNPNQEKWIYKEDVLMHIIKKYQDKG